MGVKRTKVGTVIQPQRWPRTGVQCVDSRAKLYSQIPILSLTSYVASDKFICGPLCFNVLIFKMRITILNLLRQLRGINESVYINHSAQCLAYSEYYVSVTIMTTW